jgi:cysteine desulfurase
VRAYFDYNATTPVHPTVLSAMTEAYSSHFGNASSIHTFGQQSRQQLESARRSLATLLAAKPEEIVFTSGGTESNNLALFGALPPGAHIITSSIEHPAVLNVAEQLHRLGHPLTVLPVSSSGIIDPDDLRRALRPDTRLVSLMAVNNEIGTLQPIREVSRITREANILLHCDAVQAPGRIPIDVNDWGVDLLSLSAHKIYGPKGIGALYVRKGTPLSKHTFGGHHERDRRPGTENVPAAVGFGLAASRLSLLAPTLRDHLEQSLLQLIPGARLNGHPTLRAPNVSNLCFPGIEGESLVIALDLRGFAVSSGAACSSGSVEPSHVLLALGLSRADARSSLRFSLGEDSTPQQVDALIPAVVDSVARLRKLSPAYA